jgi:hypothetical protein
MICLVAGASHAQCNPAISSFNGTVTRPDGTSTGAYHVVLRVGTPPPPPPATNVCGYFQGNCTPNFAIPCPCPTTIPVGTVQGGTVQVEDASRNTDCGVTVLDLLKASNYLAGRSTLDNYGIFAIDVRRDGQPDELDVVEIQKVIRDPNLGFPGAASWEYFPSNLPPLLPPQPLLGNFPIVNWLGVIPTLTAFGQVVSQTSFFGAKMGDVDHSCRCQAAKTSDLQVTQKKAYVKSDAFSSILFAPNAMALQASFTINPDFHLDDLEIEYNQALGIDEHSIRIDNKTNSLVLVFASKENMPLKESDWLFKVKKMNAEQPVIVGLNSEFKNLLVTESLEEVPFSLSYVSMVSQMQETLLVWPTVSNSIIQVESPSCTQCPQQILVTDITGRVNQVHSFAPNKTNQIDISTLPNGIYSISGLFDGNPLINKFVKY